MIRASSSRYVPDTLPLPIRIPAAFDLRRSRRIPEVEVTPQDILEVFEVGEICHSRIRSCAQRLQPSCSELKTETSEKYNN